MKKNSLTMAVAAGIAGVAGFAGLANAVDLNPDGLGQVLIYPYYTVNNGQDTLLSVVNTDSVHGKAVKVRFLEGYNSREVLDFNLFLSPNDVWTATVSVAGDGGAVKTDDKSCTFPPFTGPQPFRNYAFDAKESIYVKDGGLTDVSRTREGYVEIIQMADIDMDSELGATILHDDGVPECKTSITGNDVPNHTEYFLPLTGGLFGAGAVVNVHAGTYLAYNADAIDGFRQTIQVTKSGDLVPSLASVEDAVAYVFNNGTLLTLDYNAGRKIDAISALFQSEAIYNEYVTDSSLGAATDWVITFPTKRFYVDPDPVINPTGLRPPFHEIFHGVSNVEVVLTPYDREERTVVQQDCDPLSPTPGSDCDWSPSPPVDVEPSSLPYEVNVISFLDPTSDGAGETSGVLGSHLVFNVPPFADAGWIRLDLASGNGGTHALAPAANGTQLAGLPVTGFMAYNLINDNVHGGVLANYGALFRHRASRGCAGEGACS